MTIADVLAGIVALTLLGLGFGSLAITFSLVFPRAVERAAEHVSAHPRSSFVAGLGTLAAVLLLSGILLKVPSAPARLLGLGFLLATLTVATLGGTGLAVQLGRRLRDPGKDAPSTRDLIGGALLLESAVAFPIVGWFVVFPIAFLVTLGAGLRSLFTPRPALA